MARSFDIVVRVVRNDLAAIAARLPREAKAVVRTSTFNVQADIRERMRGPKHGRVYRRGAITRKYKVGSKRLRELKGARARFAGGTVAVTVGYRFHRASAPGEAPAIDFGFLVNSVQADFVDGGMVGMVFSNQVYAAALEFGTRRMEKRPAFDPALEAERGPFMAAMRLLEERLR